MAPAPTERAGGHPIHCSVLSTRGNQRVGGYTNEDLASSFKSVRSALYHIHSVVSTEHGPCARRSAALRMQRGTRQSPSGPSGARGPEQDPETREEPSLPWRGVGQTVLERGLACVPGLVWGRDGPHHRGAARRAFWAEENSGTKALRQTATVCWGGGEEGPGAWFGSLILGWQEGGGEHW